MPACKCIERKKPANQRKWRILQYKCNHSAFNGWRYQRSDYSAITCLRCRMVWRTKANYVEQLPRYSEGEQLNFDNGLTDKTPMPQGKFKGQPMENVPYWHLLWLDGKPFCNQDVQKYIDENRDVLELEKKRDKYRNESENSN